MFQKALEKEIKAIGITDYFDISNFKKVIDFVNNIDSCDAFNNDEKEIIKNIFILPNIELRILPSTNKGSLINIHCIFNPNSNFLEQLENDFFGSLEDSNGNKMNRAGIIALGKSNNNSLDNEAAYKKGIKEFHLETSQLIKLFKNKSSLKENTIITVSNSNQDGASACQKHYKLFENETGSLEAVIRNIYTLADAIFSGNPKDKTFFLGEKSGCNEQSVINDCGSLKPCIHGSDAHCEDQLFNPNKNRFCWIKADLTFEGLKQILCEPKDRVKIQQNKPEEKTGYHVIKSIKIKNNICNQTIPLNNNLNVIIGGRSTGKSTLLQLIAYKINPNISGVGQFIKDISQNSIEIIWQDEEKNKDRDIEFFPQNHMYEFAREKDKKNELIQTIVNEKEQENMIKDYHKFCDSNKSTLRTNIDDLFKLQTIINELNLTLKEKGDKNGLEKEIKSLQNKIKNTHQNQNQNDLNEFEVLKKEILKLQLSLKKLEKDKNEISILKNENLFDSSFTYKFNQLSDLNTEGIQDIFDVIKQRTTKEWQDKLSNKLEKIDQYLEEHNNNIQQKKETEIFKKGMQYLEENKQYKEFNDRLKIENNKLEEIICIQNEINKIKASYIGFWGGLRYPAIELDINKF